MANFQALHDANNPQNIPQADNVSASGLIAAGGSPLILQPGATDAIQTSFADGTQNGGSPRGDYATDFQRHRSNAAHVAGGDNSVVGGGENNRASATHSTVAGGLENHVTNDYGTIAGGRGNDVQQTYGTIGGGQDNVCETGHNTIAGGDDNRTQGTAATVGGGANNDCGGAWSVIAGGQSNQVINQWCTIAGGKSNLIKFTSSYSTIAGGESNKIETGEHSTISGGFDNDIVDGKYNVVGGGDSNSILNSSAHSVIAGGNENTVNDSKKAFVVGDRNFAVGADNAVVTGKQAKSVLEGQRAHANGQFAEAGDAQSFDIVLRRQTTDASAKALLLDGSSLSIEMPENSSWVFNALVTALKSDGSQAAAYRLVGGLRRDGAANPVLVGSVLVTVIGEDDPTWDCVFNISGANPRFVVNGAASTTINWVCDWRVVQTIVSGT